jgi:phenylalanine-4-hydroxylase
MLQQDYDGYTAADHHTWSVLFNRQVDKIKKVAYAPFGPGLYQLDFSADHIPDCTRINEKLENLTGWQIYAVPGLIDNCIFFEKMLHRHFGATTWIRKPEQLDYLEEPDMFHDVFGHIPLLTDPLVCDFLHGLAGIAARHRYAGTVVEMLARLYWYTIEFGLVKEDNELKICGAGILSSIGETDFCLSDKANRVPFDIETISTKPVIKDKFQDTYFVLDSIQQLRGSLLLISEKINATSYAS